MAEAVGLTLSAVALASLFTTCVELIEYFELSRNYESDYEIACVKLSLQKARLDSWGDQLNVRQAGGEHADWEDKPHVRDTITRSLLGIKNIFSDAEILKNRYSLVPRKSGQLLGLITRQGNLPFRLQLECSNISKKSSHPIPVLRRKTTWAIRDKQKFDRLVKELDFFITNLERVRDRLEMDKDKWQSYNPKVEDDSNSGDEKDQRAASAQPFRQEAQLKPDQAGAISNGMQDQTRHARHTVPVEDGKEDVSKSVAGHEFSIGKQSDLALVIQGPNDVEKIISAPENQVNQFLVKEVNGRATTLQGFNGQNAIESALKYHYTMIARKDKTESVSSPRGGSKQHGKN